MYCGGESEYTNRNKDNTGGVKDSNEGHTRVVVGSGDDGIL